MNSDLISLLSEFSEKLTDPASTERALAREESKMELAPAVLKADYETRIRALKILLFKYADIAGYGDQVITNGLTLDEREEYLCIGKDLV